MTDILGQALGYGITFGVIVVALLIAIWYLIRNHDLLGEILETLKGGLYFKNC